MLVKNINIRIQEALKARERALSRSNITVAAEPNEEQSPTTMPNLSDISTRSTFVRMVSNKQTPIIIQGGKFEKNLNFDGTDGSPTTQFGFKNAYKEKSDGQIRPYSGIKDISIEYTGGYSAIRKGTVNWHASSLDDLDQLAPHFLNVGNTVLLDWGWVFKRKELNNYNTFLNEDNTINPLVFSNPMPIIFLSNGNYDAIGGVISNFEYKLTEDGGFDCVTHITSIGINFFDSSRIDKGSGDYIPVVNGDNTTAELNSDDLISAIINLPKIIMKQIDKNNTMGNRLAGQALAITGTGDFTPEEEIRLREEEGDVEGANDIRDIQSSAGNVLFYHNTRTYVYKEPNGNLYESSMQASGKMDSISEGRQTTVNRHDFFVRWGWFEDNILSRYATFINKQKEIISTFRSIEPVLDEKGMPTGQFRSVLIRNNSKYLIPRDPMKFFLPGQNIRMRAIADFETIKARIKNHGKGYGLLKESKLCLEIILKSNSDDKLKFADENASYGRLRNIMINVKEIQKAFGIDVTKLKSTIPALNSDVSIKNHRVLSYFRGQIYGTDVVTNPPADVKSGLKRLLSQLTNNFYGFWNFEVTQDPFTLNVKAIETNATAGLTDKSYTKFKENSHKVNMTGKLGMYKFPSYKLGSMIKSQELNFKIPDSMAVTAAYGSNKNKNVGVRIDTTNTYPELETFFEDDGDIKDVRLEGLQKAFRSQTAESDSHSIGNSSGDANIKITTDGSFEISPNIGWWDKWSEKRTASVDKVHTSDADYQTAKKEKQRFDDFSAQVHLLVLNLKPEEKFLNESITRQVSAILQDNPGFDARYGAQYARSGDKLYPKTEGQLQNIERDKAVLDQINELNSQKPDLLLTGKFYTFQKGSESAFEINLFDGGESILRSKLFNFDKASNLYQTNWLIPAELSLQIDGISGITPGDILQTDYILPRYNIEMLDSETKTNLGPRTFFQTFGLVQRVTSEEWTTEITCKMRMNNSVLENKAIEVFIPKDVKIETENPTNVDTSLISDAVYGCTDSTPGIHPDINGEDVNGDPMAAIEIGDDDLFDVDVDSFGGFKGFKALNYDPDATVNQVSETNLSNPCFYPDAEDDEEFDFDIDLEYEDYSNLEPPPEIEIRPLLGCIDPEALNYVGYTGDDTKTPALARDPISGRQDTIDNLVRDGLLRIQSSQLVPCRYAEIENEDSNTENGENQSSTDNETENVNVDSGVDVGEDDSGGDDGGGNNVVVLETVNTGAESQTGGGQTGGADTGGGAGGDGESDDGDGDDEVDNDIDAGTSVLEIEVFYGCMDPDAVNYGLDASGNPLPEYAIEDPDFWVERAIGPDNPADPCKFPVPEPEPDKGIKCTEEQLQAGHVSKYGHYDLNKGGIFTEYPIEQEELTVNGAVIELMWYCIAPQPEKKPIVETENKPKDTAVKKGQLVNSNPKPKKLISTYKGTYDQNYGFLYKVTPWYARGAQYYSSGEIASPAFQKKSFYGEANNASWKDGDENTKTGTAVSFWIRKKFWDEWIEEPNELGISKWTTAEDHDKAYADWQLNRNDFAGYEKPVYFEGQINAASRFKEDWLPVGKDFGIGAPFPTSRYPKNNGKSSANELSDRKININEPIGYVYETVPSGDADNPDTDRNEAIKTVVKKREGVNEIRTKEVWR